MLAEQLTLCSIPSREMPKAQNKTAHLTDEQEQIIESSRTADRLVVNALAGTGKTSTAIACARAQEPCNIIYSLRRAPRP